MSIFPEGTTHYNLTSVTPVMIWGGRVRIWLGDCWSVSVSNAEEMLTTNEVVPIKYIQLEQENARLEDSYQSISLKCADLNSELSALRDDYSDSESLLTQLEQEKLESVDAWNSQLEKASAKVKGLEQEVKELKHTLDNACIPWGFTFKTETPEAMQESLNKLLSIEQTVARDPSVCRAMRDYLAQHDKEVAVKAIKDFFNYLSSPNVAVISDKSPRLKQYLKQLQEQE